MKVKLSEVVFGLPIFGREYAFIVTCDQNDKQRINTKYHIPPSLEEKKTLGKHSKGKNFQAVLSMQYLRYRLFFHAEIKLPKTQKYPSKSIYVIRYDFKSPNLRNRIGDISN